ncbi:MAG: terminase family protein, partial [Bacilli bacterium]
MLSEKQLKIFAFSHTSYDGLICSGSVRSGKTSVMAIAFVDWAMENFDKTNFAICGKTVGSCIKNVVEPYLSIKYHKNKGYNIKFTRSDNKIVINFKDKTNIFYLYGGRDNSSYSLIQGITLGGVLFDEVALMPRSFVEQAIARCSITGSKFWFNCNPEHPHHWFYLEWIQKA